MRVLLLNQTFYPDQAATSQQLLDFAQQLQKQGCEVTVMASRRAYTDPKTLYPAEQNLGGIRVVRVGSTGFGRRSFFHRFIDGITFEALLLARLLFFRKQDCVIAFTSPPLIGFIALLFTWLRGGKCVQWLMDLNPDIAFAVGYLKPGALWGRFLTSILRFTIRNSDFIVVLDRWMRNRVLNHGAKADRIVIVPPWPVTQPTPAFAELGDRFRKRHGITQRYVVLYSGNHSIAHPLDTLLQAALEMRDDDDLLFLFIGGGLRAGEVTQFAQDQGLSNIRQLPHQPRDLLQESLSAGDLHVVVMGEGMSGLVHLSKIYGVLASGRPYLFIGPTESHVADLVEQHPYGYTVEHQDVQGLKHILAKARGLTSAELVEVAEKNTTYVAEHCSAAHSLTPFMAQVIRPIQQTPMRDSRTISPVDI